MSLNNIALSNSLLAGLYANVLVQGDSLQKAATNPVPFLGGNKKNILVVVQHKHAAYLPEKELAFLTTVLSACGLNLSDVAIVNWLLFKEKSLAVLQAQFAPRKILLLDVEPRQAGLAASELYMLQTLEGFELVAAPPLSEIEKTKQAKSKFWIALKQLFCL